MLKPRLRDPRPVFAEDLCIQVLTDLGFAKPLEIVPVSLHQIVHGGPSDFAKPRNVKKRLNTSQFPSSIEGC